MHERLFACETGAVAGARPESSLSLKVAPTPLAECGLTHVLRPCRLEELPG